MMEDRDCFPLITFVVPAHNAVGVLRDSIDSLLRQTSDNWEAIIVDDGSTDGTGNLIDLLACGDKRIIGIHQKNEGVSSARNTAIEAAHGIYLAFLDADDTVVPDYVNKAEVLLEEHRPDVVALGYRAIPRNTTFGYGRFRGSGPEFLKVALSNKYAIFPCWLFMVAKRLVVDASVTFTVGRRTGEDQEFVLKALYAASSCVSVDEGDTYYIYRAGSESSAMSSNLKGQFDYPGAIQGIRDYIYEHERPIDSTDAVVIDRLLIDRYVGACGYAAEKALVNGASDADVLCWLEEVLKDFNCRNVVANDFLKRENRFLLFLWDKYRFILPLFIKVKCKFLQAGMTIKDLIIHC